LRILFLHAKNFYYEVRSKALNNPEPLNEDNRSAKVNNALVAFTCVEREDKATDSLVRRAVEEIMDVYEKVKAKRIVIYPYAHLSNELAPPEVAIKILNMLYTELNNRGLEVVKAPFGWYKRFLIEIYGHPLSELSRSVQPEEVTRVVKRKKEEYAILTPDGRLYNPDEYEFKRGEEAFRALVEKEALGKELPGGKPKYLEYCKKFGIEWEKLSDVGHMRYGPLASMIIDLISLYSWECAKELGIPVLMVKGTNMFDLSDKAVREHAELYGDRLYSLKVGRKWYVLRYAACHQQFSMLKDWTISYKHLPLGVFELADSYRLEQPGELLLCFRLRKFYMPDLHILCKDLKEAMKISIKVHRKIYEEIRKIGRDYVSIYNLTRSFFNENKEYVMRLVEEEGKPALLRFVEEGKYYWVINVEYNIIDSLGRPREIGTFQIDVGNSRRFGITYVDESGRRKYPIIIHTALIGSVERYLYALLDTAVREETNGKVPSLPFWLSPIQVRVIPISENYLDHALKIASEIESKGFRVDIDDRDESLSKKVRDAETLWIPYIVVIGEEEAKSGRLSVRIRKEGKIVKMKVGELIKDLESKSEGFPKLRLYLPKMLSRRPLFK